MPDPQQTPPSSRLPNWMLVTLLAALVAALFVYSLQRPSGTPEYEVSYSRFKHLVADGEVTAVNLQGEVVRGTLRDFAKLGPHGESAKAFRTRVPAFGDEKLLPMLESKGVDVTVGAQGDHGGTTTFLLAILPWLFLIGLFYFALRISRSASGLGGVRGDLQKFLQSTAKTGEVPDVTFADVAGQDNAKRDVAELVEYLRHPDRFTRLGAEVPRGVLLMGPPGTGKTLLARALAGEAGVPFFSISASEFIEVFVGVGAARVRHLFESAKKQAPSIIFVDELDSVGRTRGTGLGGGHDEREQTLNQILAEMDGFSGHEQVIVLAATNRPDVLDPALLRPGRFDRHVTLDLPDLKDREAILKVHVRKVPLAEDVDLHKVAAVTPGFSGADLKNLINEAAMLAARERDPTVSMRDFEDARDKILLGAERSLVIEPDERHRLAVHEAGHATVAHFLPHADPLEKVTIIPHGSALGVTHQLPEHERHTLPEDYLRDRLALMLGGRAAEKALLGTVSSGADDDIRQVTSLARAMVARWGMSDEVGPVDLRESEAHPFLGREIAQPRSFSESSARTVDHAVHDLVLSAQKTAIDIITAHRTVLEKLVAALETKETLDRSEIEACLGARPQENSSE